jgi:hypothetical protein
MARLVVPRHVAAGRFAAANVRDLPPDTYKDRLVKYIPAESIAFYTFTDKMLIAFYGIDASGNPTKVPADTALPIVSWGLFLLTLVGTPIYLRRQQISGQPWQLNATLATIAFVLWAYTLSCSIVLLNHWYNALLAGLAAPVFTFVAGAIEPKSV